MKTPGIRVRGMRGVPATALALWVLGSWGPCVAHAQEPLAIVRRAGTAYRNLTSLQADFIQVIEDARLGDTLASAGRLYQAGQNNFAMRFTDPPEEAIIIDGKHSWFYTPSTAPRQVIRMTAESDPVYGQNLLARVLDRPGDRYETTWLRADTLAGRRVSVVSIVPRGTNLNFSRAVLWLDQEDALPRRIELDEGPGTRRILTLSKIRTNAPIARDIFEFKVPRGVRIVDQ